MAHEILQELCNKCGECYKECPIDAIIEDEGVYTIVEDECVDCGKCAAECKENAIFGV